MSLRAVNLNLLPILRALLNERGVSRAAKELSLSQGATSDALAQLRILFDDPLLVRMGMQMVLTPRAAELVDQVDRLCDEVEAMLAKRSFDPATSQRAFVVATSDHFVYLIGQQLMESMAALAPHVEVQFVPWDPDVLERLGAREVDFLLMPRFIIEDMAPAPIRMKTLFQDGPALMFRQGHPLESKPEITDADLNAYRHVWFNLEQMSEKRRRSVEPGQGATIARVWPVMMAPLLLPGTDHLSLVPRSLAVRMARDLPLGWRELSLSAMEIDACLAWSTVMDADAGHHWFKSVIERAALHCNI